MKRNNIEPSAIPLIKQQRPIKFRAWQKVESLHRHIGMYDVDDLVFYHKDSHGGGEAFLSCDGAESQGSEYFDDIVLMQFTGLKDRHGVEIYEGDIVRWFGPPTSNWDDRGWSIDGYLVAWEPDNARFTLILDPGAELLIESLNPGRCEVIGNIYENPELLQ